MVTSSDGRKRVIPWSPVAIFYETDFPDMATHEPQVNCGYSLYKGVLVQWDEDRELVCLCLLMLCLNWCEDSCLLCKSMKGE